MDELVMDSSVALAWVFGDESNAYADALLDHSSGLQIVVPMIWPLEVANALLVAERRGRATRAETEYSVQKLDALPIILDDQTSAHAMYQTLELARTQGLSAYDAAYLELAIRAGLPLATLDQRLRDAAAAIGVPLFALPEV